jgi:tetratricopeptide (TPR) repeat protein
VARELIVVGLIAGVVLCALGVLGIVVHLLRRGRWRTLRSAATLYQQALTVEIGRSAEPAQQALTAWQAAGTPPTSARLRVRVIGLATAYAERLRGAGRPGEALTHLTAAEQALAERVDADPTRFRPLLADILTTTCAVQADLGHTEEALRVDGWLVPLLRDLADVHPTRYARPLGLALAAEARHFHEIGRAAEALAAAREATGLLRTADPAALATAGTDHAAMLLAAGRNEEALTAVTEAVAHGARAYDGVSPDGFRHCVTLTVLGRSLLALGRAPLAEAPLGDALTVARTAAHRQPALAGPWLADVLTTRAQMLTALDRPEEAITAAEEAALLSSGDDGLHARALCALAAALLAGDRPGDARTPAAEAVELYKRLGRYPREQAQAEQLLSRL